MPSHLAQFDYIRSNGDLTSAGGGPEVVVLHFTEA